MREPPLGVCLSNIMQVAHVREMHTQNHDFVLLRLNAGERMRKMVCFKRLAAHHMQHIHNKHHQTAVGRVPPSPFHEQHLLRILE